MYTRLIDESSLDNWVRGNPELAKGAIVDLVSALVKASSPEPNDRRFPSSDSINQTGQDGYLDAVIEFKPYVPIGKSYWEIGAGGENEAKIKEKASKDYSGRTRKIPKNIRDESTFIFITPRSGQKGWTTDSQNVWLDEKKERGEWKEVKIIDGTRLVDWLGHFPAVEGRFAAKMGKYFEGLQPLELRWEELRTIGEPPPLPPKIFLIYRGDAVDKLKSIYSKNSNSLKLLTHYEDQVANFVAAYVASIEDAMVPGTVGRSLIVSNPDSWRAVANLTTPHIFIADFDIEDTNEAGTRLLEIARQKGHAVVYRGRVGGIPDPSSVDLPNPTRLRLEEALREGGYSESRSRLLANKSAGKLNVLLRLLQNLSPMPGWASGDAASDLAIAQLLGAWNEERDEDRATVEKLVGKEYGEWIGTMREATNLLDTPLTHKENVWKFSSRYEGWFALAAHIYDSHLKLFEVIAIEVLGEKDPKFELPLDQQYMAIVKGKDFTHSKQIRKGIATTLALLGSYPEPLKQHCSMYLPEIVANEVVENLFKGADGIVWASLNDLLPLFAEAAPEVFLKSVEQAMMATPSPFIDVFAQESTAIFGWNYMTGLLWALELLAWNEEYLLQVIITLGELAELDPGGTWANRPKNSIWSILLPWKPQTCASIEKRQSAVKTLLTEIPAVGWQLVIDLIDSNQKITTGNYKPLWRNWIPDDWKTTVTTKEYYQQLRIYEKIAIEEAVYSSERILDICNLLDKFSPITRAQVISILQSEVVMKFPEDERNKIWTKLLDIVTNHRKYADADWAMDSEFVNEIADIANILSPTSAAIKYLRLFVEDDYSLFGDGDNFEQQQIDLSSIRIDAIDEIFNEGGPAGVQEFAQAAESSWKVGWTLGKSNLSLEDYILPKLLDSEDRKDQIFLGSFLESRVQERGWDWFDSLINRKWSSSQIGRALGFLPFTDETWLRVENLLRDEEEQYWTTANVNPYRYEGSFERAIDSLIKFGRPYEAIACLNATLSAKKEISTKQAIAALNGILSAPIANKLQGMNEYHIQQIIKNLQESTEVTPEEMINIEFGFLPLFQLNDDIYPKTIEQDLATNPESFCELIRILYRSKKDVKQVEPSEEQKAIATRVWHLLNDWRIVPGTDQDGSFNGKLFEIWLKKMKASCTESGHLDPAMIHTGQVLIHAPGDPNGLWIHTSVANALNAKDAGDMRSGFSTALFNSRGTHFVDPEGKPEMKLAQSYFDQADSVEAVSFQRLARTLKQLGKSYEREAERIRDQDPFDD